MGTAETTTLIPTASPTPLPTLLPTPVPSVTATTQATFSPTSTPTSEWIANTTQLLDGVSTSLMAKDFQPLAEPQENAQPISKDELSNGLHASHLSIFFFIFHACSS